MALAAEPCCASDFSEGTMMEFQTHTTTPKGWPRLFDNLPLLRVMSEDQFQGELDLPAGCRGRVNQASAADVRSGAIK